MFKWLKKILKEKPEIALFVDGPNILRKSFSVDLTKIKTELRSFGNLRISKVYLDQYASDKLIEAMVNQGFESEITTGDVDVTLAIEAMEAILDPNIDIVAIMSRDTDFRPLLIKAKKYGKKTIIIGTDEAFSVALKNTADTVMILKRGKVEVINK